MDNLLKSSVSPIAKEKEVLIASVIDDSGDIYFVLQGGPMPSGTNNYFVMDVGVDVGTSGSNTQGTLAMLHSPGIGGSTRSTWDASKINGEYQRLTLVWSGPQTAGLVLGPFKGVGTCLKLKVTESGKVDKFAVGSQSGLVVTDLSINPLCHGTRWVGCLQSWLRRCLYNSCVERLQHMHWQRQLWVGRGPWLF